VNQLRKSRVVRSGAWVAILGLFWTTGPSEALAALAQDRQEPRDRLSDETKSDSSTTLPRLGNRKLPQVTAPSALPKLSEPPTDVELFKARVFEEPLIPEGPSTGRENRALGRALESYLQAKSREDISSLESFLAAHPTTVWKVAILTNLSIVARRSAYFTKTLQYGEEAWRTGREAQDAGVRALAERGLAEFAELSARLGRLEELKTLLNEVADRSFTGAAGERISQVRESLWLMENRPERAYRCGPLAIGSILTAVKGTQDERVDAALSTPRGTSLLQMQNLANQVGLEAQMAKREAASAPLLVPSLVHWKAGHFGALVRAEAGRYLLQDPTFGDETWVTADAVEHESDGYFLVLARSLPAGWRNVDSEEGASIWGKGAPPGQNTNYQTPSAPTTGGNGGPGQKCPPMAVYWFNEMLASLVVADEPVGYTPPRGPEVRFRVTYNQREAFQPAVFTYGNVGAMWTFNWLGYITDDASTASQTIAVYEQGGGQEVYTGYNPATQSYGVHFDSRATVTRVSSSPLRYERKLRDGTVEVYGQPDGALTFPRKVFLTEVVDPQGHKRAYVYDSDRRLVAVADALGQVTTLSYESADPLRITQVTDPFGRHAQLEYDSSGRLFRITDVIGLVSQFAYTGNLVSSLTTPYGTTTFSSSQTGADRSIQATDPLGGQERQEFVNGHAPSVSPASDLPNTVPSGFSSFNHHLDTAIGVFWDKRAMALTPGNYAAASITQWAWTPGTSQAAAVPRARKRPLEGRVWYAYPGQSGQYLGTDTRPTTVARVLDDGVSQLYRYEYGPRGNVVKAIDPSGRETKYTYGTGSTPDPDPSTGTGIDLLKIEQKNGAGYDLLESRTYDSQHRPLTVTDASGQTTTYTYNAQGQVLTVTTPSRLGITENRTTTYVYDTNGYVQGVTGPATGATTSYTYDGYGRTRTITDADSYTVTVDYDVLDRPTQVTYPDGTYDQTIYNRLDDEQRRDRMGRWTHTFHDALRRVVAIRDPLGNTTTQSWCSCGSLDKIIDPNGNATTFERDLQGRVTREVRADNTATAYTYENTTSRLKQVTDAKSQVGQLEYFIDDDLKQVTYTNAAVATPSVSFTYDPVYNRPATMVDGTGSTSYSYNPIAVPPMLGAGRLANVDGPLTNDTVTYGYDELGRGISRSVNGVGLTQGYDALGRITGETNPLGSFTFAYDGVTNRLASASYPNGQTMAFAYYDNAGDRRLQEIHNKLSGGATLSKFGYSYDPLWNITAWTQQTDASPGKVYEFNYDSTSQLLSGILKTQGPSPSVLKRYGYAYDKGGNRATEQIDDTVLAASHNALNQLTSVQPGGALRFAGTVSEPATVTIGGTPGQVAADNSFLGTASVPSGTSTVAVAATDPSGNTRTNTYQVSQSGSSRTLTYDLAGNLTSDGARTYEWDGASRLVAVTQGAHRSEFTYDGVGRRVRVVEKDNSIVTSDRRYVWCDASICEERDAAGSGVLRRFFTLGVQDGGAAYFYAKDHLGSIREVTDFTGAVRARYDYDPYGRTTKVSGDKDSFFGYSGLVQHQASGLELAQFRAYDPDTGRWLSNDPLGFDDGTNLYAYVHANPIGFTDAQGLLSDPGGTAQAAYQAMQAATATGAGGAAAAAGAGAATVAVAPVVAAAVIVAAVVVAGVIVYKVVYDDPQTQTQTQPQANSGSSGSGSGSGASSGTQTSTGSKTKTQTQGPCQPCPPPPPPIVHLVPPSKPHYPCFGDHIHYFTYSQGPPPQCICRLQKHTKCMKPGTQRGWGAGC